MNKSGQEFENGQSPPSSSTASWSWRAHPIFASYNGITSGHDHKVVPLDLEPARVPATSLNPLLVTLLRPGAIEAEPYRALAQVLAQRRDNETLNLVAISSPTVNDGKTIVTLNLAGALAHNSQWRVLVIDADLRHPSVAAYLGLEQANRPGLVEAVHDPTCSLEHVMLHHPSLNLSVLLSGSPTLSPYEVLGMPRLGDLLDEARQRYDYVFVDTPPLLPFTDCRLLAQWVDGFFVIVAAHKTPRKLIDEALDTLPGKLVGLAFNQDKRSLSSAYDYYYHYRSSSRRESRSRSSLSR